MLYISFLAGCAAKLATRKLKKRMTNSSLFADETKKTTPHSENSIEENKIEHRHNSDKRRSLAQQDLRRP